MKFSFLSSIAATLALPMIAPRLLMAADIKPNAKYAVVVSKSTYENADWKPVVEALVKKHDGKVIVYAAKVTDALAELQKQLPRYTCFVARPPKPAWSSSPTCTN